MLEVFQLSSLTKYFDPSPKVASSLPAEAQLEAESEPLAPDNVEEAVPLEQPGEMSRSFNDQFVRSEGRSGDALAQIVAVVRDHFLCYA